MSINVFDFSNPVEFLSAVLKEKQQINRRFSLRSWTAQLGLAHASGLSMILNGKRNLKNDLAAKLSRGLGFSDREIRYFDLLVFLSNAKTLEEKEFYTRVLSTLRPEQSFSTLELDKFRLVSDWYHFAIANMTLLKNFKSDPAWVANKLGKDITEGQVKEAIERLLRLGILNKKKDGSLVKSKPSYQTTTDIPDKYLRKFHMQLINKSLVALEIEDVNRRDVTGIMMVIKKEEIPKAKQLIREFRKNISSILESKEGDSVYQLNIQFFNLLGGEDE